MPAVKATAPIISRYVFRNLAIATAVIALALAGIILLTQSLRFLELIISAGASGGTFFMLSLLALPRFLEVILPVALLTAILFVYNRMALDSEMTVLRSVGFSPLRLARPALALTGVVVLLLFAATFWLSPLSVSSMQQLRQVIKAQYSVMLFREGVFNALGPGLTVFVRKTEPNGELRGLMIHDSRPPRPGDAASKAPREGPVTILAQRGTLAVTAQGQEVIVYDGSRQSLNPDNGALNRLDFSRYTIDLPEASNPVRQRWREPEERTFWELLHPDPLDARDVKSRRDFTAELHRRLISPFIAPVFAVTALCFMLFASGERRGQSRRMILAVLCCLAVQAAYMALFQKAADSVIALLLMYVAVLGPLGLGLAVLAGHLDPAAIPRFFAQQRRAP